VHSGFRHRQPSAFYGVASEQLGDKKDSATHLSSGVEVRAYYKRVMDKFLKTGRVRYFPLSTYAQAGTVHTIASNLHGQQKFVVVPKKLVDASYHKVVVPAMRPPAFDVAPSIKLVPVNGLADSRTSSPPPSGYVIIGAGKTAVDALAFLLNNGVPQSSIRWIISRDSWYLDRADIQPQKVIRWLKRHLDAFAEAPNGITIEAMHLVSRHYQI
jgi:hypothetical protein